MTLYSELGHRSIYFPVLEKRIATGSPLAALEQRSSKAGAHFSCPEDTIKQNQAPDSKEEGKGEAGV